MATREQVTVYGGLAILVLTVAWWLNSPEEVSSHVKRTHHAKATGLVDDDENIVASYVGPPFPKPDGKLRDVFMPVSTDPDNDKAKSNKLEKIPANLAGDGNWIFTGIAQISGSTEALLENSSKHEYGFVHEGQAWKRCHVGQITSDKVSFYGPDGEETVVFRFNPSDQTKAQPVKEAAATPSANPDGAGAAPVQPHPNFRGAIGMPPGGDVEVDASGGE